MAQAFLMSFGDSSFNTATGNINLDVVVFYTGTDVPGTFLKDEFLIAVNPTNTPAAMLTQIVTGIQNEAVAKGFTVPANNSFVPSFQRA